MDYGAELARARRYVCDAEAVVVRHRGIVADLRGRGDASDGHESLLKTLETGLALFLADLKAVEREAQRAAQPAMRIAADISQGISEVFAPDWRTSGTMADPLPSPA